MIASVPELESYVILDASLEFNKSCTDGVKKGKQGDLLHDLVSESNPASISPAHLMDFRAAACRFFFSSACCRWHAIEECDPESPRVSWRLFGLS